jgi:hypothetical protein
MKKLFLAATAIIALSGPAHAFDVNHKPALGEFAQQDYECKYPYQDKYAWVSIRPQANSVVVQYGDNAPTTYSITNYTVSVGDFINRYGQRDMQWVLFLVRFGTDQGVVNDVGGTHLRGPQYQYDCAIDYGRKLRDVPAEIK